MIEQKKKKFLNNNLRSLKTPIDVDLVPVFEFLPAALKTFPKVYQVLEKNNWVNIDGE
jgi:hypothetical protein